MTEKLNLESNRTFDDNDQLQSHHLGEAIPITIDDIEREMVVSAQTNFKSKDTSTSKEGISTWILLSENEKNDIVTSEKPDDLKPPSYRLENDKKLTKNRNEYKQKRVGTVKPSEASIKNKGKGKTTTTAKPTKNEPTEMITKIKASAYMQSQEKKKTDTLVDPVPISQPLKPKRKSQFTTTTTTTTSTIEPVTLTTESYPTYEPIEVTYPPTPEPVTFLIMEPKDADFDLPQDRSPGHTTKKPKKSPNKNKKKNNKRKPTTESSIDDSDNKVAIKPKPKPISSKIYNYISREIMPTVGVGLVGLVVTAGLASYFFGPLGALRRSYDISDRKDDLYQFNNEEYASTDGESEEEMFGKVIAGMPSNSLHRNNIRYTQARPLNHYQPVQQMPQQKYQSSPYNRYRNVAYVQKTPSHNGYPQMQYRNAAAQVQQQQPHEIYGMNNQKSISNPSYAYQSIYTSTSTLPSPVSELESTNNDVFQYSTEPVKESDYIDPNTLKRRSQFVVGSVLPDSISADEGTAPVPEHGPRRKRRSISSTSSISSTYKIELQVQVVEKLLGEMKQRNDKLAKNNEHINKEIKRVEYGMSRLKRIATEVIDIEKFQQEFKLTNQITENNELRQIVYDGITHVRNDVNFINELLDKVNDETAVEQMLSTRKELVMAMSSPKEMVPIEPKVDELVPTDAVSTEYPQSTTYKPSGFKGLLRMLELKAQFGINVLRSIRPAFDKAFHDVFQTYETTSKKTFTPSTI